MLIGIYSPAPQSGKSTVATRLIQHHNFVSLPFAGTLKGMISVLLEDFGIDDCCLYTGDKSLVVYNGKTVRELLQTLGTEWGRNIVGKDLWADVWRGKVKRLRYNHHIVCDDVRFENEAHMIMELGGIMLRVIRPAAAAASTHASEGGLDNFPFAATIRNEGTVEDLRAKVDRFLEKYK
jgi:hypothetical protein